MKNDIWTYGTTKLLLLMACKEMVHRLEGSGVTVLTAWPGIAGVCASLHVCILTASLRAHLRYLLIWCVAICWAKGCVMAALVASQKHLSELSSQFHTYI